MHCGVLVLSITSKLISSIFGKHIFYNKFKERCYSRQYFCRTFQEETSDQCLKIEDSEASQVLFYLFYYKTVMRFGFYSLHSIFHIKCHAT